MQNSLTTLLIEGGFTFVDLITMIHYIVYKYTLVKLHKYTFHVIVHNMSKSHLIEVKRGRPMILAK